MVFSESGKLSRLSPTLAIATSSWFNDSTSISWCNSLRSKGFQRQGSCVGRLFALSRSPSLQVRSIQAQQASHHNSSDIQVGRASSKSKRRLSWANEGRQGRRVDEVIINPFESCKSYQNSFIDNDSRYANGPLNCRIAIITWLPMWLWRTWGSKCCPLCPVWSAPAFWSDPPVELPISLLWRAFRLLQAVSCQPHSNNIPALASYWGWISAAGASARTHIHHRPWTWMCRTDSICLVP